MRKLSGLLKQSLKKICGIELNEDLLDQVSGGRQMNAIELKSAYDILMNASREYANGIMSYEQYAVL